MICTCIVCGKPIEQKSMTPKLYCSDHCRKHQGHHQIVPLLEVQAEAVRRKAQYIADLSPEQRKEREKAKRVRTAFHTRQAKIQGEYGDPLPNRLCHNPMCRRPTWDYYCPECRRKMRQKAGLDMVREDSESVWDGF